MSLKYKDQEQLNSDLKMSFLDQKNIITDTLVISKNEKNETISIFKDDIWDLSGYSIGSSTNNKLEFNKIPNDRLRLESKEMMLFLMIYKDGNNGSLLSVISIVKMYYTGCIIPLVKYAYSINKSLFELLINSKELIKFIKANVNIARYRTYISLLNFLHKLDNKIINIDYKKDEKLLSYLTRVNLDYRYSRNQTVPIPIRILSESIQERLYQIEELSEIKKDLLKFISYHMYSDKDNFIELTKEEKINTVFKKYNINNRMNFISFFTKLQGTCKNLIHAFSGMRDKEVFSLNENCFKLIEDSKRGRVIAKLEGFTTKLTSSRQKEEWIVSKELEKVIDLLLSINEIILKNCKISRIEIPLFLSTRLLRKNKIKEKIPLRAKHTITKRKSFLELSDKIKIRESDIEELELIDPFRDWRNDKDFLIGEDWLFKSHQYRRSLALYSIQSGLVSIGCLQIQLKHLCKEMSLYYGKGASLAKEIININKTHISNEFNTVKDEVDAISYIKNVLFSDEQLFGGYGSLVDKNMKNEEVDLKTYILENKKKTMHQFKNGEIQYKETSIGGCVSTKECSYLLTRSLISCGFCDSSIIKESKLLNIISKQKDFIKLLDKNSVEYRMENEDLKQLEKQLEILLRNKHE